MEGKFVEVGKKRYKVVKTFPVLWCGWECDSAGYVVEVGKGKKIVMSSHGRNYFAKPKDIKERLDVYKDAIEKTRIALDLVGMKG